MARCFPLRITNQATRVEMHGIPYFAPFMEAQRTAAGSNCSEDYSRSRARRARPVPAGLLAQVQGRTNLVLYDWETTGRRLTMTNPPGTAGSGRRPTHSGGWFSSSISRSSCG